MKLQKTMPVAAFKAHCLSMLSQVAKKQESLLITKHGKPIAKIIPLDPKLPDENPLKNTVVFEKDIISPLGEIWSIEKE